MGKRVFSSEGLCPSGVYSDPEPTLQKGRTRIRNQPFRKASDQEPTLQKGLGSGTDPLERLWIRNRPSRKASDQEPTLLKGRTRSVTDPLVRSDSDPEPTLQKGRTRIRNRPSRKASDSEPTLQKDRTRIRHLREKKSNKIPHSSVN